MLWTITDDSTKKHEENDCNEVFMEDDEDAFSDAGELNCSDDLFKSKTDKQPNKTVHCSDNRSETAGKTSVTETVPSKRFPVRVSPRLWQKQNKQTGQTNTGISNKPTNPVNKPHEVSVGINSTGCGVVEGGRALDVKDGKGVQGAELDDTWSDEELFEEDSFIIKATQIPEDIKMFNSPVFYNNKRKLSNNGDQPKSKQLRSSFQLEDGNNNKTDNAGKKSFTGLQEKGRPLFSTVPSSNFRPSTTASTNITVSAGPVTLVTTSTLSSRQFTQQQSHSNNGPKTCSSNRPAATSSAFGNVAKINNFKKHNSFSGSGLQSQSMSYANCRKRSLSGDFQKQEPSGKSIIQPGINRFSVNSASRSCAVSTYTRPTGVITTSVTSRPPARPVYSKTPVSCKAATVTKPAYNFSKGVANTTVQKAISSGINISKETVKRVTCRSAAKAVIPEKNSDFDTSLSDDLLCQLAEPDEVLDSQICSDERTVCTKVSNLSCTVSTVLPQTKTASKQSCVLRTTTSTCVASSNTVTAEPTLLSCRQSTQARQFKFRDSQKQLGAVAKSVLPQKGNPATTKTPLPVKTSHQQQAVKIAQTGMYRLKPKY